jgi:hypothetical protein
MGYGEKVIFHGNDNPGPGSYNPKIKENIASKMALGREVTFLFF